MPIILDGVKYKLIIDGVIYNLDFYTPNNNANNTESSSHENTEAE